MILGIDTGGTFTDFVLFDGEQLRIHKVLSTPSAPEQAILKGVEEMGLKQVVKKGAVRIVHGTTVATNATLEGQGARTAYIANQGFKDILHIGRQTRRELYNLQPSDTPLPLEREYCLEVAGRINSQGEVIERLTGKDIHTLVASLERLKPDAIAINHVFSFINPSHELQIKQTLQKSLSWQPLIVCSSEVLPQYKEYERGIATWLNARLGPLMINYLTRLEASLAPSPLAIMQSSGGTMNARQAGRNSVRLLLSGPAGGLVAANRIGELCHSPRLVTFDMGGTSTDVALLNEKVPISDETHINQLPIAIPSVAMHTIGAGGGSIAYIDEGGILQVGPRSAGAHPGPACYGRGSTVATVSDANAILGRLQEDFFLGGEMQLDIKAAKQAVEALASPLGLSLEETAQGILDIVNEHMSRALRKISVGKGYDLGDFKLCCFGGAGGLHICALADSLEIKEAIVPVQGGVFSALGLVAARAERHLTQTHSGLLSSFDKTTLLNRFDQLAEEGRLAMQEEGLAEQNLTRETSLNLRYQGQAHSLNISWQGSTHATAEAFTKAHQLRYGHKLDNPVELVDLCVTTRGPESSLQLGRLDDTPIQKSPSLTPQPHTSRNLLTPEGIMATAVYRRAELKHPQRISGPALICEQVSTTWLESGWAAEVDVYGNLLLQKV